jgi:hypothetical protein
MKIANKFQFFGLLLGAVMFMSPALAQMVTFKTLDKVTAKISSLEAEVGLSTVLGPLTITVRTCKTTPPEEPPETSVYLEIDESRENKTERLFSGWMFASSPGLNGLEHPVYDLWPESCKMLADDVLIGKE